MVVAVVLFAFLLNWRTTADFADGDSGLDPDDGGDFSSVRAVDQHDDARRYCDRDRRTGRRRRRRCREHLPAPARESRSRRTALDLRGGGVGVAGGEVRDRLRHGHHHPGLRAAVRAVGHRGAAVCAARPSLHHLDSREPRRLGHAHAGDGLLHAAWPAAAAAWRRRPGPPFEAGQRRDPALGVPSPRRRRGADRPGGLGGRDRRHVSAAQLPAGVQRGQLHHQHGVQPGHLAVRVEPGRPDRRTSRARCARGEERRPPDRAGRTRRARRGRAFVRSGDRPQAGRTVERRDRRRSACPAGGAAGGAQCRPADLPPSRPHAVGRARADRPEGFRRRPRRVAGGGRAPPAEAGADPRDCGSAGREAGSHPAARDSRRLPPGRALRRAAGGRRRSDQQAVERPRHLAGGRRLSPLRRDHAAARPAAHHAKARRPADRDAGRLDSRPADCRNPRDRRPQSDPAGEWPPARGRIRQHGQRQRHGAGRRCDPARSVRNHRCRRGFSPSSKARSRRRRRRAGRSACCRCCRSP